MSPISSTAAQRTTPRRSFGGVANSAIQTGEVSHHDENNVVLLHHNYNYKQQKRLQQIARQREVLAENLKKQSAAEIKENLLVLSFQAVLAHDASPDIKEQAISNDGGGVNSIFSSAFTHIPR